MKNLTFFECPLTTLSTSINHFSRIPFNNNLSNLRAVWWNLNTKFAISYHLSHHAAVQILLHLAEGVGRCLSLARDDDADVSDSQGSMWLDLRCPAVGDINALRGNATDIGWTTRGCGLDEVATMLQSLLPCIQHAVGEGRTGQSAKQNFTSSCSYCVELVNTICGHALNGLIRWSSLSVTLGISSSSSVWTGGKLIKLNVSLHLMSCKEIFDTHQSRSLWSSS